MTLNKNIVLWGATGQAIVLEEFLKQSGFTIIALFDNNTQIDSPFKGIPVYTGKDGFHIWHTSTDHSSDIFFAVAIGGAGGKDRVELATFLIYNKLLPATLIHPRSYVATNAFIEEGAQILANSTVCARSRVGRFSIINTQASIDHECILESGVHIGPGAHLAGCVYVKKNSFIGVGASVLPHVTIGENCIIGAGAAVLSDIPDNSIAVGVPAKVIKTTADCTPVQNE